MSRENELQMSRLALADPPKDNERIDEATNRTVDINTNATLININDDCLRQICLNLDLVSARNLASTCYRLREFVNAIIFPKFLKRLDLFIINDRNGVCLWKNSCRCRPRSRLNIELLRSLVIKFGDFVEHVSFTMPANIGDSDKAGDWKRFGDILRFCANMKTLRVKNGFDGKVFLRFCNVLPHLKEFHWIDGIFMSYDSDAFKHISAIEKITVTGPVNFINSPFFEHFKKLSYLHVQQSVAGMKTEDFVKIFGQNVGTLRTLALTDFGYIESDSIFQMIDKNLPNLETLRIVDRISMSRVNEGYMELRRINTLELFCLGMRFNIDLLMQILCRSEMIEELTIFGGKFCDNNIAVPLTFKSLQKLTWIPLIPSAVFCKTISRIHMPELRHLTIYYDNKYYYLYADYEENHFDEIVKIVESKRSLTSLCVMGFRKSTLFVQKIIEMLKADVSNSRPFLRLGITHAIRGEEVSTSQST